MKVGLWAEIRRLAEIEKLSARVISRRLHCSWRTVAQALEWEQPPARSDSSRVSLLDPYKAKIDALLARYPELSAVRVHEEIARGPDGYTGSVITVRRHVRSIRPARGRVYQEVHHEPAQAMQVDWGECGRIQVGNTSRKVSVLVAVLCYSRMTYIEFTLSQRKAEFYRCLVHALEFFGASPRAIIFDNLKTAVLNGSGPRRLFSSRVSRIMRLLPHAADRLRTARSRIERYCRGEGALREAKCPGRSWRRACPLRGLRRILTPVA
jgi:transposase